MEVLSGRGYLATVPWLVMSLGGLDKVLWSDLVTFSEREIEELKKNKSYQVDMWAESGWWDIELE